MINLTTGMQLPAITIFNLNLIICGYLNKSFAHKIKGIGG